MELINNFQEGEWSRGDPQNKKGYESCRIVKFFPIEGVEGGFRYAVFDDNGGLKQAYIYDAYKGARGPLYSICNCWMKFKKQEENQYKVIGVIVEDECVIRSFDFYAKDDD